MKQSSEYERVQSDIRICDGFAKLLQQGDPAEAAKWKDRANQWRDYADELVGGGHVAPASGPLGAYGCPQSGGGTFGGSLARFQRLQRTEAESRERGYRRETEQEDRGGQSRKTGQALMSPLL